MHNDINVNHPKKKLKRGLLQAKGFFSDRVHSDQMVLGIVRQEAGPQERQPKALKTKLTQGGAMLEPSKIRWFL
jgi:hypothetical protein